MGLLSVDACWQSDLRNSRGEHSTVSTTGELRRNVTDVRDDSCIAARKTVPVPHSLSLAAQLDPQQEKLVYLGRSLPIHTLTPIPHQSSNTTLFYTRLKLPPVLIMHCHILCMFTLSKRIRRATFICS
jgi:hypothetical protein